MTDRRPVLSALGMEITPAEHKALLEIRELFAANKFHHDRDVDLDNPKGFNMNVSFLATGDPNWPEVTGLLNIEVEHA